jgi:hypothetical protein
MGGWNTQNILGKPWVELPAALADDLLKWRWLYGIGTRIRSKQKESQEKATA